MNGIKRHQLHHLLTITLGLGLAACGGQAEEPTEQAGTTLAVDCQGKCDGWSSIRSLYRDARELDLGDLLSVGAGFATEELNDTLSVSPYAGLSLSKPKLYTTADRADSDLTLGNIDELVTGLAARFGERELSTEVNALRRDHLYGSNDTVFAEYAFGVRADMHPRWNVPTEGFDGKTTLGFDTDADLTVRAVAAFETELGATGGAPLAALRAARGFVLPRSVSDIQTMKTGELIAVSGAGGIGLNVGVGVPLLIANPVAEATYNLVLSAGLRTHLHGQMDVQLVRMAGDEVVIDVGVDSAQIKHSRLALTDGWGVQGLLSAELEVLGANIDIGRLVERALERQLNRRLNFINALVASSNKKSRLSVARMRFSLNDAAPELVEQAIAQALRGDVRLAQALANRGEPGFTATFDLSRSGVSATSYAGIDIFSMSFFSKTTESQGSVVAQTPGGARTLLFESLHRSSGWFFSSHGFTRVGLSGLVYDPASASTLPTGEANLMVQIQEGDDFMERDKLLDHLDSVILGLGGPKALSAIEGPGNALELFVEESCPDSGPGDPCRMAVIDEPTAQTLRAQGAQALAAAVTHLEPAQQELVKSCGQLRLSAQATLEPAAALVGPETSVVVDYRLDDAALEHLMTEQNKFTFRNALENYLGAVGVDRQSTPAELQAERAKLKSKHKFNHAIDTMAARYEQTAKAYRRLLEAERAAIATLGPVGPRALEIRFEVSEQSTPDYESAAAQSLSSARSKLVTRLYDELRDLGRKLPGHDEQPVSYALLQMTPPELTDLRVDVKMDVEGHWLQAFAHYRKAGYAPFDLYAKGQDVAPIDGGLFDVSALLNVQ